MSAFATAIVRWQKKHGRHDLPWQRDRDPYKIWLSEIMLQQTQVTTVIPYYQKFLQRFPTLAALAQARQDSVLTAWSGLGYYARARNLHAAARHMHKYGLPADAAGWHALPGIGKSTAAAIAVFAFNQRQAILDGNVKRVLARTHLFDQPLNTAAAHKALWPLAESLLPPKRNIRPYTQGLMDIGATRCLLRKPQCERCPLTAHCLAYQQGLSAHYPVRGESKPKPQKTARLLLIRHGAAVLLQRQPPGIWEGLWSLPPRQYSKAYWQNRLGCALKKAPAVEFKHEFTHYRLAAHVTVYECQTPPAIAPALPLRWQRRLRNIALPAPVRQLLTLTEKSIK